MKDINTMKATVLTAALPYIQKYYGKTVVIKYGGNAMIHPDLKKAVMSDIILLSLVGIHVVLIHGGGPEISGMLKKLDIESRFVNGLRYTDKETAEVVQMVLAGKTNKDLVGLIGQLGGKAVGLCGIDGCMIQAKKLEGDYGYVGDITKIDTTPIVNAINSGYIPVVATVGTDCKGNIYNINADTAAAEIAGALHAENIITLTDIRGLMEDVNERRHDPQSTELRKRRSCRGETSRHDRRQNRTFHTGGNVLRRRYWHHVFTINKRRRETHGFSDSKTI